MSKKQNKIKGNRAEDIAAKFLEGKGYKIVNRNYRCRYGEIDIIAEKENILAFCEVKAKTGDSFGTPEEMVDDYKLTKINDIIDCYVSFEKVSDDLCLRIDVVAIDFDYNGFVKDIRHVENFS